MLAEQKQNVHVETVSRNIIHTFFEEGHNKSKKNQEKEKISREVKRKKNEISYDFSTSDLMLFLKLGHYI